MAVAQSCKKEKKIENGCNWKAKWGFPFLLLSLSFRLYLCVFACVCVFLVISLRYSSISQTHLRPLPVPFHYFRTHFDKG